MSSYYRTVQGDTWDMIAYQKLGSERYTAKLIEANRKLSGYYVFPAGMMLLIPEIENVTKSSSVPPWKRVSS